MKYAFGWNYRSSYYAAAAGDVVELDDDLAAIINRDSPGVLVPFVPEPEPAAPRTVDAPQADRMQRAPGRKRGDG